MVRDWKRVVAALIMAATTVGVSSAQTSAGPIDQIAGGPGLDIDAGLSSDGRSLIYASSRGGNLELWMRSLEGGVLFQITSSADHSADRYPIATPDGKSLVFQSDRVNGTRNIWSITLASRALAQLTNFTDGGASHPALSPDGKTICFTRTSAAGDVAIWLMSIEGRALREIAQGLDCAWTPNGQLVFARGIVGAAPPSRFEIWTMDPSGKGGRAISAPTHDWCRSPSVSPNGRWLAYTVYAEHALSDMHEVAGGFEINPTLRTGIWLVDLRQPTAPARLIVASTSFNSYSAWARDRDRLFFTSTRTGSADIWAVEVQP